MRATWLILCLCLAAVKVIGKSESRKKCQTCNNFVESFKNGLKSTENSNFEGGDTSWEEANQPAYAHSEVRLVEILDSVCERSDYECFRFLEDHEEDVEKWWFKEKLKNSGLKSWLCFDLLDICCPDGSFGQECEDCPGGRETPCSSHGICEGEGEKDGAGGCSCDLGYEGEHCNSCQDGYFNTTFSCAACDSACKKSCTGAGPANCKECAKGYRIKNEGKEDTDKEDNHESKEDNHESKEDKEDEEGEEESYHVVTCEDINECKEEEDLCKEETYCQNTPGSYECKSCHKACEKACDGPGPRKCLECADGYRKEDGTCVDINECKEDESICEEGKFCENTEGSYKCKDCDKSCQGGCGGWGPSKCNACASGYKKAGNFCIDINECVEGAAECEDGKYCENMPGSYHCLSCHFSCELTCHGSGPSSCVKCKDGYVMEDGSCADVNECESSPCDQSTELCSNTAGSYACKCLQGLVQSKEGNCIPDTSEEKKSKKKGKSRKGAGSRNVDQQQPAGDIPVQIQNNSVDGLEPVQIGSGNIVEPEQTVSGDALEPKHTTPGEQTSSVSSTTSLSQPEPHTLESPSSSPSQTHQEL